MKRKTLAIIAIFAFFAGPGFLLSAHVVGDIPQALAHDGQNHQGGDGKHLNPEKKNQQHIGTQTEHNPGHDQQSGAHPTPPPEQPKSQPGQTQ